MDILDEKININNTLVVPAYRKFCKDQGLKFHFWDELPENEFNSDLSTKEFALHKEAMNLFNGLKSPYCIYDGKIFNFKFVCEDGDFVYNSWSITEFVDMLNQNKTDYAPLMEHFKASIIIAHILFFISIFSVYNITVSKLLEGHEHVDYFLFLLIACVSLFGPGWYIKNKFKNINKTIEYNKCQNTKELNERLSALRNKWYVLEKTMNRKEYLTEKANELVENASILVKIYVGKLNTEHPQMISDHNTQNRLEYFCTIAFVFCVCVRLSKEVEEELRTPMETIVQKHLSEWYFESSNALDDINGFIKDNIVNHENRSERCNLLFLSAAKWAIENSFFNMATEPDDINYMINIFSDIFKNESAGYWENVIV